MLSGYSQILIWSGASAVGGYVIQLASQAGLRVITTASPKHEERLKALGASVIFDYHDKDVSLKIREFTKDKLASAADCTSTDDSAREIFAAIGSAGGIVSLVSDASVQGLRTDVVAKRSAASTL